MLAKQRQAVILEEVRRSGGVRVSDLTELLQVSDMTIRRDLDALAERGLVEKVHGGATAVGEHSTFEPGFEAKRYRERPEKEAIAELAATLVHPGSAIGLNAGTTTWALARRLGEVPNLIVVTNSIQVAGVFHQHDRVDQTVVLTGGLRTPSDALVGPVAIGSIRSLNLDVVFMGVHGMDPRRGFTTPNLMEAEANRALAEAARRVVVVADHTKWGVVGLCSILALDQAQVLVTDAGLGDDAREVLAERVGELLLAPVGDQAAEAG
jgi:DeoR/GlpR family transcriptional regulator of sugar metabolism